MARLINRLTEEQVETIAKEGMHSDGGNLYLRVAGMHKYWLFKYASRVSGRDRQLGIGPIHTFSLAEAREKARQYRQMLADGTDPIDDRHALLGDKSRKRKAAVGIERRRVLAQQERIIAEAKVAGIPVLTGRQVRSARALARLTLEELAEMAGISRGTLALVERRDGRLVAGWLETRIAIAAALRRAGIAMTDNEGCYVVRPEITSQTAPDV